MKRSLISSFLIASFLASSLVAQQQTDLPKLVESVEVRVINIDVVVTDKRGNPIRGLKAEDFEVTENGRAQKITNFAEISSTTSPATLDASATAQPAAPAPAGPETPAPAQRRMVVFYIDNLTLKPFNRNRVFTDMKKFAKDVLRPGDQAMIVTWNRSMKIRVPFTSDHTHIQQTLDAISGESAEGIAALSSRRQVEEQIRQAPSFTDAVVTARQKASEIEHELRQSVTAINGLMSTLAGVEGKKILVLTTEGFPMQPGKEFFTYIDEMKKERADWAHAPNTLFDAMSFNSTHLLESIGRAANANGITMYTLHAGGLSASMEGTADNSRPIPYAVTQAAVSNSTDSLHLLADLTGGRATVGTSNFKDAFARIQRDLDSYYSIGYRSGTERVDRQRNVEVRAKNRAYVVRARKTFVEKSIGTEMTDRVVANLFYPSKKNDLNILVTTGLPVQVESDRFKVPVDVRIPMQNLTFLPQGEVYLGGFTVFVGVSNKLGDMSDINRKNHRITLTKDDMPKTEGKYYTYSMELLMEKGRNKISIGVVDEISNMTGFDVRDVLASDL